MSRLRDEQGAGLVEMLVVMVVLGLLSTAVFSVVRASVRAENLAGEVRGELDSVQVALDRLRKDLRSTREIRVGSDDKTVHLWLDADQNGVPAAGELVSYALVASGALAELRRSTSGQPATVVARRLADQPAFSYAPDVVDASVVTITLTAPSTSAQVSKSVTHSTVVRVRNE